MKYQWVASAQEKPTPSQVAKRAAIFLFLVMDPFSPREKNELQNALKVKVVSAKERLQ